jgi:hypothetical protein
MRRELCEQHKALLRILYRTSDWISENAICRELNVSKKVLSGIMGSFGRICSGTSGWPHYRGSRSGDTRPSRYVILRDIRGQGNYYCITPLLYKAIKNLEASLTAPAALPLLRFFFFPCGVGGTLSIERR